MMSSAHEKKRATMKATLEAKTGRDLNAWLALLTRDGPFGYTERLDWLKKHHGLGHFQARLIIEETKRPATLSTS
jgi:hypothetical protein